MPNTENLWVTVMVTSALTGVTGLLIGRALSSSHDKPASKHHDSSEYNPEMDKSEECKMALVVRTDLKMGKGKAAAQCAHAAVGAYKQALYQYPQTVKRWERSGQMKVTLQCGSEDELELLEGIAMSLQIPAQLIHDAGRTQIAAGSATVLGLGPAPKSLLDKVTGELRLF